MKWTVVRLVFMTALVLIRLSASGQSETTIRSAEIIKYGSCDFRSTLSPALDLSGITAITFDFYTTQSLGAITAGQFELTASGREDAQEYHALTVRDNFSGVATNRWVAINLPFDIDNAAQVGRTGSPTAGTITAINFFRLYLSNEPNADYKIRNIKAVIGSGGTDTQAPTVPTGLAASGTTETGTNLSWTASTDNVGVTGYDIYRNNAFMRTVTGTSHTVTGLTAGTTYSFKVRAKDAAGNQSAFGNTVNVTTPAGGGGSEKTIYAGELTSAGSCDFRSTLSPALDLSGITAITFDFYTSQSLGVLTGGQFELTASGREDAQEYHALTVRDNFSGVAANRWVAISLPFDIDNADQVGHSGSPTASTITAINFFRLYLSNEPTADYKIRNIKAVIGNSGGDGGAWTANGSNIHFNTGKVGIGTTNPGKYKLAVEGKIGTHGLDVRVDGWSDFVFAKDYNLKSPEEVDTYIKAHGHLPDMPSEAEIMEEGHVDVSEMLKLHMQKIEELTLYVIEQNKRLEAQQAEIETLKKANATSDSKASDTE